MRIVIDMQAAQTAIRFSGICSRTICITQAIVRNCGSHEIFLALSGMFPDTIEYIRAAFKGLLPQENIQVWYAPKPEMDEALGNDLRLGVAQLVREAFLLSFRPDVIHLSHFFDNHSGRAISSIGRFDKTTPVSVAIFELAPLLYPGHFSSLDPFDTEYHFHGCEQLGQANLHLVTSEYAKQEVVEHLNLPEHSVVNVYSAIEELFQPLQIDGESAKKLGLNFGLTRSYILALSCDVENESVLQLIRVFGLLPQKTREQYQLLVVGDFSDKVSAALEREAKSAGLVSDEFRLAGYVTDEILVQLYNLCKLVVIPAWKDGFALPALQAMACNAVVIGSNTASLPEVLGFKDALFDPTSDEAVSLAITRALVDDGFRKALIANGRLQAQRFSWDACARRMIAAFEAVDAERVLIEADCRPKNRPRLAYVSPLPPERTGIADYSAELLPSIASTYEIDVIVDQEAVWDLSGKSNYAVRKVEWFVNNWDIYDRVIYHFGNSVFHQHMFDLLKIIPGVVVLHDFFLGDVVAQMDSSNFESKIWNRELYHSHGYEAVRARCHAPEHSEIVWKYPCNLSVLENALGVIVHSQNSISLAEDWYGIELSRHILEIPHLRVPATNVSKKNARSILGVAEEVTLVCAFGILGPTKLNHRLLNAWLNSALAKQSDCHLIFVGENHQGEYGRELETRIQGSLARGRISITGWVNSQTFHHYLAATDIGVQLRSLSRGETSGTVLDCMNYGVATIVNSNGSMAELDQEAVWLLPDSFEETELVNALEVLWRSPERRFSIGERARQVILDRHSPDKCAQRYADAIEYFYSCPMNLTPALIHEIGAQEYFDPCNAELAQLANSLAASLPLIRVAKYLYLDISATCRTDLKTGIERVVRALVLAMLKSAPKGYRIEPVYLDESDGQWRYRRACRYTLGLLECPITILQDEIVEPACGDILLGLDVAGNSLVKADGFGLIQEWRGKGVQVYFMVHDLLPIRMPEVFPPEADRGHENWLGVVSKCDGVICVSKAVAADFAKWLNQLNAEVERKRSFMIGWSHHGADMSNSSPSKGLPSDARQVLNQIRQRPSFLMVGTIEPRKAYLETINSFSELWGNGIDVNLIIVGKEGWKTLPESMRRDIPQTIEKIKTHPELNKRLLWLDGISDEFLEILYEASACLIAASYGEGFGLPLIEAAQHNLPIIARDISVFREVAGDYVEYYSSDNSYTLSEAVKRWLLSPTKEIQKNSMTFLSWQQSATNLFSLILNEENRPKIHDSTHYGICLEYDYSSIKNLFVDVSVVSRDDFKTGIQRAVRSILSELISNPPNGYRVVPVRLDEKNGQWSYYPSAQLPIDPQNRRFFEASFDYDHKFSPRQGDILLGLDLAGGYVVAASDQGLYQYLMQIGVSVYFVVYDLLPITLPDFFNPEDSRGHLKWAERICKCSGVICISKSVENEYLEWHKLHFGEQPKNIRIGHFHLGGDIESSSPTSGLPEGVDQMLASMERGVSFLIVGTIEPRKGHLLVIEAFERLWDRGFNVKLIIVGKIGWMAEHVVRYITGHSELNQRLFWLEGISDEYLKIIYATSNCLISSSLGEGFGLPLIEAAKHKLPIIARDIPVFREVAGEHAFYFSATIPCELAFSIEQWLDLYASNMHPKSDTMPWLTWEQSTQCLLEQIGIVKRTNSTS